ncbi:hypothetical protein [Anatilimnocola floriformis]|uniref:hypothetical protein n=1 Tax=Anatilimnocola floriformis TaxID=2948575 RepID=UPI0020C4D35F|nr:hypothetical protein [Anatilimnocola floriformis]
MELLIEPNGLARCIYTEEIDLAQLGTLTIRRGSHVEPDERGCWLCDLSPVSGPVLGPFESRGTALAAEVAWLSEHWLVPTVGTSTDF